MFKLTHSILAIALGLTAAYGATVYTLDAITPAEIDDAAESALEPVLDAAETAELEALRARLVGADTGADFAL